MLPCFLFLHNIEFFQRFDFRRRLDFIFRGFDGGRRERILGLGDIRLVVAVLLGAVHLIHLLVVLNGLLHLDGQDAPLALLIPSPNVAENHQYYNAMELQKAGAAVDWEKIITREERNVDTLKDVVRTVYSALKKTEKYMAIQYDYIEEILPKDIFFITSQELEDMYPGLSPKDREYKIVKEKGAVFIMQIGKMLASGEPHDGRAPDYDDWELNGDIIVYYPVLDIALELSSMGIRVDAAALKHQLEVCGCEERAEMDFQRAILNDELPFTIGGGIGQSRICMFYLRKAHIGEVHCSLWPEETVKLAEEHNIPLL